MAGARGGSAARRDLWRGWPAMAIPTPIAQRGTSGATTGPRGAAGPHNPDKALACSAPPNPDNAKWLTIYGLCVEGAVQLAGVEQAVRVRLVFEGDDAG